VTTIGPLLVIAALTTQSPAADTLRLLASHLPDSALAAAVLARPFAVRDAVTAEPIRRRRQTEHRDG